MEEVEKLRQERKRKEEERRKLEMDKEVMANPGKILDLKKNHKLMLS